MNEDDEIDDEEMAELEWMLQEILEGDDEELARDLAQFIDEMHQNVSGEGPKLDEDFLLTRLHQFLMKHGMDLEGLEEAADD